MTRTLHCRERSSSRFLSCGTRSRRFKRNRLSLSRSLRSSENGFRKRKSMTKTVLCNAESVSTSHCGPMCVPRSLRSLRKQNDLQARRPTKKYPMGLRNRAPRRRQSLPRHPAEARIEPRSPAGRQTWPRAAPVHPQNGPPRPPGDASERPRSPQKRCSRATEAPRQAPKQASRAAPAA